MYNDNYCSYQSNYRYSNNYCEDWAVRGHWGVFETLLYKEGKR